MPSRISGQRRTRSIAAVWGLVDAGSSRVVRDPVVGSAISGTRRKYPLPLIGHRSGKLTVTGYVSGERHGVKALLVKCDCGRPEYPMEQNNFKDFRATRCHHCAKEGQGRKVYWKYYAAMADTGHRERLLNRLSAAITRCHNPQSRTYKDYGGRGIHVWRGWIDDRAEFLRYVQLCPGWDDPSREMDRRDNNAGYEPGNIRFVTRSENAFNKRSVGALEKEIARLRSIISGATESVYDPDW